MRPSGSGRPRREVRTAPLPARGLPARSPRRTGAKAQPAGRPAAQKPRRHRRPARARVTRRSTQPPCQTTSCVRARCARRLSRGSAPLAAADRRSRDFRQATQPTLRWSASLERRPTSRSSPRVGRFVLSLALFRPLSSANAWHRTVHASAPLKCSPSPASSAPSYWRSALVVFRSSPLRAWTAAQRCADRAE